MRYQSDTVHTYNYTGLHPFLFPYGVAWLYHDCWRAGLDLSITGPRAYSMFGRITSESGETRPLLCYRRDYPTPPVFYPPIGRRQPFRESFALYAQTSA